MEKLIDITSSLIAPFLDILLQDKTTKKNIIWATDSYQEFGEGFGDTDQIKKIRLLQQRSIIKPRIQKSLEAQQARTRKKAEVFTPAWLCNMMNNYCDEVWFGRKNVFNRENEDHTWSVVEEPIEFPQQKHRKIPLWQRYIDSRRLEITCGEAPYLVSRYDVSTGEIIYPLKRRIGLLDRKLRVVNEQTDTYEDWIQWAIRAFDSCYGYEYQGDNVLLARINLFLTFIEYYQDRWKQVPSKKLLHNIIRRIAWNIWQMDGLNSIVPLGKLQSTYESISLFDMEPSSVNIPKRETVFCKIYDWRRDNSLLFNELKETLIMGKNLFDFIIGNPPYNEDFENSGDNGNYAKPVYNLFMDATYEIAHKVELIHPARFLFNAGSTPKEWNEKILHDKHFKVFSYEPDSTKVFSNTDIKGGVAISYHNNDAVYEPIEIFTSFNELNSILKKVKPLSSEYLNSIISGRGVYKLANRALEEHPEIVTIQSKGHKKDVGAGAFKKLKDIVFFENKPSDGNEYVKFFGLSSKRRVYWWGRKDYQDVPKSFYYYKVFIPKANGSGTLGEVLSAPLIGEPLIGATETFLSIGSFDTFDEANHCLKYVKSKFARVMLGILKITQDNTKDKWKYVPLQDFTNNSDIDWSQSIHEIDLQLYKKYDLTDKEIQFIEEHVKEMV